MKKLLSILSSMLLVASASAPVVSCSINNHVDESIDSVLEQQNFNFFAQDKAGIEKSFQNVKSSDLFYSNGLDGDNKYIPNRDNGLNGSFGASKWTLIDMLNDDFNLGLKKSVDENTDISFDISSDNPTAWDVAQNIFKSAKIENLDKFNRITVKSIKGQYQQGGNPAVSDDSVIDTFNKIVKLGDKNYWDYTKQVDFLNDENEFKDQTIRKEITLTDGEKETSLTQIIMVSNTALFRLKNDNGIDKKVERLKKDYINMFGKDGLKNFTVDDFINLIFSKLNIFTAANQEYSISVNIDCNDLVKQLNNAIDNDQKIAMDYINNNNQKAFYDFFEKQSSFTPSVSIPTAGGIRIKGTTVDNQSKLLAPRSGMKISSLNTTYKSALIDYINAHLKATDAKSWTKDDLDITLTKPDDKPQPQDDEPSDVLKPGDTITIASTSKDATDTPLTLGVEETPKTLATLSDWTDLQKKLIIINGDGDYSQKDNDWLFKSFGFDDDKKITDDWFENCITNLWLDKLVLVDPQNGSLLSNRNQKIEDIKDLDALKKQIVNNLENVTFSSDLNNKAKDAIVYEYDASISNENFKSNSLSSIYNPNYQI